MTHDHMPFLRPSQWHSRFSVNTRNNWIRLQAAVRKNRGYITNSITQQFVSASAVTVYSMIWCRPSHSVIYHSSNTPTCLTYNLSIIDTPVLCHCQVITHAISESELQPKVFRLSKIVLCSTDREAMIASASSCSKCSVGVSSLSCV